ncbi:MAG TPA: hypothetical protein VGE35_02520 [Candidatus Paceibacterota bacterium]
MKRFTAVAIVLSYAAFGGLGFLLVAGMNHHDHVVSCPFMPGEQVVCSMNALEHASEWGEMFAAVIPTLLAIAAFLMVVAIHWYRLELAASPPQAESAFTKLSMVVIPRSQYQLAFSRGVIHPKRP